MASSGSYAGDPKAIPVPRGYTKVVEGHAAVLFPPPDKDKGTESKKASKQPSAEEKDDGVDLSAGAAGESIFYNKAQVVNRDLSVCAIQAFARMRRTEPFRKGGTADDGINILEALSASGLRAIRYWQEIEGIRQIIANDLDPDAVKCIGDNIAANKLPTADFFGGPGAKGIVPNCDDAVVLMQRLAWADPETKGMRNAPLASRRTFYCQPPAAAATSSSSTATAAQVPKPILTSEKMDVIDLDPYGTASPFLDSAMACAREGALLLVTCTDSAILCGNYIETCHAKYSSLSMRAEHCHEMAPRIVLAALERAANKHAKYIQPLLSLHIDFYIRVFVRVYTQPAEVKLSVCKLAHVAQCVRCPAFHLLPIGEARVPRKRAKQREKAAKRAREKERREGGKAGENEEAPAKNDSTDDDEAAEGASEETALPKAVYPAAPSRTQSINVVCANLSHLPISNGCTVCGGRLQIGGPIYAGPSHDHDFIDKILAVMKEKGEEKLKATDRVKGLVECARRELTDAPLFYKFDMFASLLKMPMPNSALIIGALCRLGYRVSHVHCEGVGLKTDAPPAVICGVMKRYKETVGAAEAAENGNSTVSPTPEFIRCPSIEAADFTYDKQYDLRSGQTGVVMFVPNAPNWGPKARHMGTKKEDD